jgi:hypothetical protein
MAHASDVLLGLLAAITLLLAAFIAAVIRANLDAAGSPAQSAPLAAVPAAAGPAQALPAGQPPTPSPPPTARRQPSRPSARTPPSATGWRPALVIVVFMAGLIIAAIGGWLFLSTGTGACTLQAAAVCAQGYVLLTTTQLFGGAVALAGIVLVFTAAFLALREQN